MKNFILIAMSIGLFSMGQAQKINLGKAASAVTKGAQALSFTNEDAKRLSKESVDWMDAHNPVAGKNSPYTKRLNRVFRKHQNEDGLKLNYKVYLVTDINAFACADGSVRVFSSLMDLMTDDELLAVIGHEIGHVKNEDTKDAIKSAYMRAAAQDAASSASGVVRKLSDTELGEMANAILDAKHSKKQESQADEYSYNFMKKHGYNVVAVYTAFKKLALLSGGATQSKFQKMMSSHPDSEKRAEAAKKRAIKDGLWKDPGEVTLPKTPIK
ncbi:M48 family metallopeptidase [Capnocytophaga sp. oral taxon 902]|uniref:M48 family metallopeptidase n=1 Tax=Capnocytophaga sp. oral taxon 902 TaxID=2748316 RepID=UPI0015B83F28|nr:M48 family metallopeptidase [Capnocytophaga sp. oral taxon 902]QLF49324.1 M48 family metallopeptidase [Capnocytophaga sp. oral taxon 902]